MPTANPTYHIIQGSVLLVIAAGLLGWAFYRALKRSDDPARLLFKWLLTAGVGGVLLWKVGPIVGSGGYSAAFVGIPATAVCGLILAFIWRHNIASFVADPITSLYDGGNAQVDPRPYYSIAQSKRKMGHYREAVAEIRKQLDKFPNDLDGQLMLAEIQAENLNDLPGAELTLRRLCNQPGHPPSHITLALYSLADWHLKLAQDRNAARQDLQKIIELYPDTELALSAAQRIAHLAQTEHLLAPHDRQRLHVPESVKDLGLLQSSTHLAPADTDPAKLAAAYVAHLQLHPLDTEIREKLAILYADHYGRIDLAGDELGQLIEQPNRPPKQVAHWLNLLADLQIRHGATLDNVRQTLERIIERLPNHSAAELARNRIELLKLELKAKDKSQDVKLGSYEQDIGLKRGRPGRP